MFSFLKEIQGRRGHGGPGRKRGRSEERGGGGGGGGVIGRTPLERGICPGYSWHKYRGISGDIAMGLDCRFVLHLEPNFYP